MRIEFEKATCSRCGGSGRMPFAVKGGICFKCNGKGEMLTRRGANAYKRVQAVRQQVCTVAASSVKPGDRIVGTDGKARTVVSVEVRLGKGNGGANDPITHEPILLNLGETIIRTQKNAYMGPAHRAVTLAWSRETLKVAAEAVCHLKGAMVLP